MNNIYKHLLIPCKKNRPADDGLQCSRVAEDGCLMQVLAGAGLQGDMMTHIVMGRVQTTWQEYQLARIVSFCMTAQ